MALETPSLRLSVSLPSIFLCQALTEKSGQWMIVAVKMAYWSCSSVIIVPMFRQCSIRLVRDTNELKKLGMNSVAIMANDVEEYPQDSFDNMKKVAEQHRFSFPYLYDESQQVAQAYGAVCTPDFFGYNKDLQLQYRGRLDASRKASCRSQMSDGICLKQ